MPKRTANARPAVYPVDIIVTVTYPNGNPEHLEHSFYTVHAESEAVAVAIVTDLTRDNPNRIAVTVAPIGDHR
jgi:hypothetical protein